MIMVMPPFEYTNERRGLSHGKWLVDTSMDSRNLKFRMNLSQYPEMETLWHLAGFQLMDMMPTPKYSNIAKPRKFGCNLERTFLQRKRGLQFSIASFHYPTTGRSLESVTLVTGSVTLKFINSRIQNGSNLVRVSMTMVVAT